MTTNTESGYTPTTDEVRGQYAASGFRGCFESAGPTQSIEAWRSEFDRWLTTHDAEVRAADREAMAEQWSEWETFRASDGHLSIRQHGLTPREWLREKAKEARDGK